MTNIRRIVKIFIGSPGDLPEERKIVRTVIDEINEYHADSSGCQVELIGWEDTPSVYGRPQAIINRELERCELFLGLLWKRWGTPPDISGPYTSGFHEEYELSVLRRQREGRPEISLLFKDVNPELMLDPGDELKRVLAFRNKLNEEKTLLYGTFEDDRGLENQVRRCVYKFIHDLKNREAVGIADQTPSLAENELQPSDLIGTVSEAPRSKARVKFLQEFISKIEPDAEQDPISAVDVARFRLGANICWTQGNDDNALGVHDANLLFAKRESVNFDYDELNGLLVSGLEHYSNGIAPLWHWLMLLERSTPRILPLYSFRGSVFSTEVAVGALQAMRLCSEPITSGERENRQFYLDSWFAKDAGVAIKIAALSYLGDLGIILDLPTIHGELEKNNYQTSSAAVEAIIRINLRESREKAIQALYDLQSASVKGDLLSSLFDNGAALSNEFLLAGVGHRNVEVRRIIVELLCRRGTLPDAIAEQLLGDDDAKIRYEAVKALIRNGRVFAGDEAKRVLMKQGPKRGLGVFATMLGEPDGEAYWKCFQQERYRTFTDRALEAAIRADDIFDREPEFILAERHFKHRGDELRKAIEDQYKGMFSDAVDAMAEKFGIAADIIKKTQDLEDHLRKELTRRGLDVICLKGEAIDLGRVRKVLKNDIRGYTVADIKYLGRFGEWEDISLIINLVQRPEYYYINLLLSPKNENYRVAASAMYALGRKRLSEVLEMSAPNMLVCHFIIEISDKDFCSLTDFSISSLFKSEDDTVRKIAAIKCLRAFPKKRLTTVLANYLLNERRHYNVIHWLDLGASFPQNRVRQAANGALNQYCQNPA